jgi:hypothetical protein
LRALRPRLALAGGILSGRLGIQLDCAAIGVGLGGTDIDLNAAERTSSVLRWVIAVAVLAEHGVHRVPPVRVVYEISVKTELLVS